MFAVRPFVRLLQNLWTHFENQWTDFDENRHWTNGISTLRFRGRGHIGSKIDLEDWRRHHSRLPWVE